MTRQIADKMASGELTSIKVGGTAAGKEVALAEDLPNVDTLADVVIDNIILQDDIKHSRLNGSEYEGSTLYTDEAGEVCAVPPPLLHDIASTTNAVDTTILTALSPALLSKGTTTPEEGYSWPEWGRVAVDFFTSVQNSTGADIVCSFVIQVNSVTKISRSFTIPGSSTTGIHLYGIVETVVPDVISVKHSAMALGLTILGATPSTLRTRRPRSLPPICLGELDSKVGTMVMSSTWTIITTYSSYTVIGIGVNEPTSGKFTIADTGWYRAVLNLVGSVSAAAFASIIEFRLYNVTQSTVAVTARLDVDAGKLLDKVCMNKPFFAEVNDILEWQMRCTTSTATLTFNDINANITRIA